jgi:hypothetical protein
VRGPALPVDEPRRRLLPFYEAYFSNYIEGTEFTLDEAAAIVFAGDVPSDRPADAHGVLGTYEVVSDPLEIAESIWHRWQSQYGGMRADDAKRLKELERENTRLKKIVADQVLDIDMLKELNRGNF